MMGWIIFTNVEGEPKLNIVRNIKIIRAVVKRTVF
jgi:hypothetical protein